MRRIIAIIRKDWIHQFSSPFELVFFIVLPVVFTVILGGGVSMSEQRPIELVVHDRDETVISRGVHTALADTGAYHVTDFDSSAGASDVPDDAVRLTIPAGFGEQVLTGAPPVLDLTGLSGGGTALVEFTLRQAVDGFLVRLEKAESVARIRAELKPFESEDDRERYVISLAEEIGASMREAESAVKSIIPSSMTVADSGEQQLVYQSIGQLITWVLITALAAASYLVLERRRGTFSRMLASPTGRGIAVSGAGLGQFLLSLIQMALLVAFGAFVLGIPWGNSIAGMVLVLVPFAAACVSMALLLATLVRSTGQANSVGVIVGMTFAMLGGCWFPLEFFPEAARTFAGLFPTNWTLLALVDLVIRNRPVVEVLPAVVRLSAFAVVLLSLAAYRYHRMEIA